MMHQSSVYTLKNDLQSDENCGFGKLKGGLFTDTRKELGNCFSIGFESTNHEGWVTCFYHLQTTCKQIVIW
jgi:hypothetical protein